MPTSLTPTALGSAPDLCKASLSPRSLQEIASDLAGTDKDGVPDPIADEIRSFVQSRFPDFEPAGFGKERRVFARPDDPFVIKVGFATAVGELLRDEDRRAASLLHAHAFHSARRPDVFRSLSLNYHFANSEKVRTALAAERLYIPRHFGYLEVPYNAGLSFFIEIQERICEGATSHNSARRFCHFPEAFSLNDFAGQLARKGILVDWACKKHFFYQVPDSTGRFRGPQAPAELDSLNPDFRIAYVDSLELEPQFLDKLSPEAKFSGTGSLSPEAFLNILSR